MFSDNKISMRASDCVLKPPYSIGIYSSYYKIFVTEIKTSSLTILAKIFQE